MEKRFLLPADILLPTENPEKWSVIACDQYTSQPDYWERVRDITDGFPSAFNIILPEAFLQEDNSTEIARINGTMREYLDSGVLREHKATLVYTERTLSTGAVRRGIVGLIDLADYSYRLSEKALIRATEATVEERIPPRVQIRRNAPLEMPHVMLLADDPRNTVMGLMAENVTRFEPLYDFELMLGGGHIRGYAIDAATENKLNGLLEALLEENGGDLLFAVGDGNHSLAAAKECAAAGGSRYALAEIVNIHDKSLEFEPIYRVLTGVNPQEVMAELLTAFGGEHGGADAHCFTCIFADGEKKISVKQHSGSAVADLQGFIDEYLKKNKAARVDYIHGKAALKSLSERESAIGFLFDGMKKDELFAAIRRDGSLPRKTFSMGSADDKRFYLECRRL